MSYKAIRNLTILSIFSCTFSLNSNIYVVNSTNQDLFMESLNESNQGDEYTGFNCLENANNPDIASPQITQKLFSDPERVGGNAVSITLARIPANSVNVFAIKPSCNMNKTELSDNFSFSKTTDPFNNIYAYRGLSIDYKNKKLAGFTADSTVNYLFSYLATNQEISAIINIL